MIHLTADDSSLLKDLRLFVEPVEVLDPSGKLLGLFVPANLERGKRLYEEMDERIDWAEIERRKTEETGQGRPLHEIFETLKTLTTDPGVQADLQRRIDRMRAEGGCDTP
jgi:hypothetical protein